MIDRALLVVSECPVRRQIIERYAHHRGYAFSALSVASFLRLTGYHEVVCVFADESAKDAAGNSLQQAMVNARITVPLVLLLDAPDVSIAVKTLRQGAISVISNELDEAEVDAAVSLALKSRPALNHRAEVREQFTRICRLSDRQRTILDLATQGVPNKGIASKLKLSMKTVERERKRAYECLGVRSTAEMTRTYVLGNLNPIINPVEDLGPTV